MPKSKADWVVAGGRLGELGHCTRCGAGLDIGLPQPLPIAAAAMTAFVKIHAKCKGAGILDEHPIWPSDWIHGRDTGVSSATIYSAITGNPTPYSQHDIPHDPDDFGRCYRLLKHFPAWRMHLGVVAEKHPKWKPFVREWDKLTEMYEAALRNNFEAGEMYEFIKQLEKESCGDR